MSQSKLGGQNFSLEKFEEAFSLSHEYLTQLIKNIRTELSLGLSRPNSMLKALPTFVTSLPQGSEQGTFLVVDLGGTNLRVGQVSFKGNGKYELDLDHYFILDYLANVDSGCSLFKLIATDLKKYLYKKLPKDTKVPWKLGFCFSYPVQQENLGHGILIQQNKSLKCNDLRGKDVIYELQAALNSVGLENVTACALVNDTVSTLAAHLYVNNATKMSLILGTGINAAYIEQVNRIEKHDCVDRESIMIINTEIGGFGDGNASYLPVTKYDQYVDSCSINPSKQLLEKMVSGLYLGQLFVHVAKELLGIELGEAASNTKIMSELENYRDKTIPELHANLDKSQQQNLYRISRIISTRAAKLASTVVLSIYFHMLDGKLIDPREKFVVVVDGSLFKNYYEFSDRMMEAIRSLAPDASIVLSYAEDESSVGAAAVLLTNMDF